jgi:DNA mismatch repair protein MutS2
MVALKTVGLLYPEDYDFDIVFDTKDNRKSKHLLDKWHKEGVEVIIRNENE